MSAACLENGTGQPCPALLSTFRCGRKARKRRRTSLEVLLCRLLARLAKETCTSVTVSGGDSPGVYERPTGSSYFVKSDDSSHVLQPLSFGDASSRRNLNDGGGVDGSSRRGLANDCTSQIWILADTTTLENEGFPYYTAFDCATHPASVESTWLLVDCDECSEVAEVTVVCTAAVSTDDVLSSGDSGDGVFTLPVIIGIVAGGLVFLLCIGFCFCQHRRRVHKGSQTFDDSTHSRMSHKPGGFGANGAAVSATASSVGGGPAGSAPPPAYITAVDETVGNPIPLGAAGGGGGGGLARGKDASGDVGLLSRGRDAGSFKPSHNLPAFEGIFASRNGGDGGSPGGAGQKTAATAAHPAAVEMAKYSNPEMMRKDSMAAAAAAASAASRSQGAAGSATVGDTDMNSRDDGFSSVLSSGVVEEGDFSHQHQQQRPAPRSRQPAAGGGGGGDDAGITWTAGQNLNHRRGYEQASESYGGDSAAGSVYDLQAPDDEEQHPYQGYDDSVAASSPGAYSMYSHYTAGGGAYAGGGTGSELWSSDDGGSSRVEDRAGAGGSGSGMPTIPSPAGLVARADWNSKRNMGAGGGGEGARGGDPQRR
ncbi:unnamed protein product [Scytosiphon promiscuus]